MHGADGVVLEGEYRSATTDPRAVVVLCHPHPQMGGSMRSVVISPLFDALPALGYSCLRFNFRGVERSTGEYGEGATEPADVVAAIDEVAPAAAGIPLVARRLLVRRRHGAVGRRRAPDRVGRDRTAPAVLVPRSRSPPTRGASI